MHCFSFLLQFNFYILYFYQVHSLPYSLARIPGSAKESHIHAHSTQVCADTVFSKPSQFCESQECKHLHFTRDIAIIIQNTHNQCVQIQPINTHWENTACDCLCSLNHNGRIILPHLKAETSIALAVSFLEASVLLLLRVINISDFSACPPHLCLN